MTSETWRRIEETYHAALERPTDKRPAFLDVACAGDEALRSQVERLLKAHAEADGFLAQPALEAVARAEADHQIMLLAEQIAHYKIVRLLGAGGMGQVYLAEDTRLDRRVALKIPPSNAAKDQGRLSRFIREAKAASALNHPNIATIYDVGEAGGIPFFAMEYVEGQTLANKSHRFSCEDLISIGIQIAAALDAAHSKGLTHRDIKTGNIMITPEGQVKVLDFGLAKFASQARRTQSQIATDGVTTTGVVMGTVPYMSPEQALGREMDYRTDIFSLGIVLYEMATARLPFQGATATETIDLILHAQPESITRFNTEAPAELERIVDKCLEKERDRRYQAARDLLVDLRNLQRDSGSRTGRQERAVSAPSNWSRRQVLAMAAFAALAIGTAGAAYLVFDEPHIDSIAVLPFVSTATDPEAEAFSDGVTQDLISTLAGLELRVIAFRYKGKDADAKKIGEELNVPAVLQGTVQQSGDTVTIKVQLVDALTGAQLWRGNYESKLSDIFETQDRIATQIAEYLRLRLSPELERRLTKRYTDNVAAYQLYQRGRFFALKYTAQGTDKAIESFRQAIRLDQKYALAYAGLAEAYLNASGWYLPARQAGLDAKEAALKAVELDDSLSEAHSMRGLVAASYDWDWQTAEQEFKRSIDLKPGSGAAADYYGYYFLAVTGRLNEALAELKRAQLHEPLSPLINQDVATVLYYLKRYDEAIAEFRKAIELDETFWVTHVNLGLAYVQEAMYPEAIAEFEKTTGALGFPDGPAWVAYGFAMAGKTSEARQKLDALKQSNPPVTSWAMAFLHAGLGDRDQAFEWLEKARDEHFNVFATVNVDPAFDSLRSNPRFAPLMRSIRLRQ